MKQKIHIHSTHTYNNHDHFIINHLGSFSIQFLFIERLSLKALYLYLNKDFVKELIKIKYSANNIHNTICF